MRTGPYTEYVQPMLSEVQPRKTSVELGPKPLIMAREI
jgi:hypothetical protein